MSAPALKYLFRAEYGDGTVIEQTQEDKPKTKETGSAYSDVDVDKVVKFHLISEDTTVSVDLTDGHFEVNNFPFTVHDQHFVPKDLRLIYFRETHVQLIQNAEGEKVGEKHYVNRYFIGWQNEDNKGKNLQHVLAVS